MNRFSFILLALLLTSCNRLAPGPEDYELERAAPPAPVPPAVNLEDRIDKVLADQLQGRLLSSTENAAWQIMHGVICYGHDLPLDTPDRGRVKALDYAFSEGIIRGWELRLGDELSAGRRGVRARLEPGSYTGQGHVDQWIAICAMAELPPTDSLEVDGQRCTLLDWAEQARLDASANPLNEFSWSLIAQTYYFPDQPEWVAADGSTWSWERMLAEEVQYDINLSPCGGAHRLVGMVRALQAKQRLKLADSTVWDAARRIVDQSLINVEQMRSSDGSLSSHYFERPGASRDLAATLASSGHLFEFLANAADERMLAEPWVETAAQRLCQLFEATRSEDLDCGACYHALNGLRVYRARRYPDGP